MARSENMKKFRGIKFKRTERGFSVGEWTDRYGEECSIQDSSLATEACIWLGVDNPSIKVGPPWEDFVIPPHANIASRMHLTIPMAKKLRDALTRFIETGSVAP